jgi:hypothetical protein
MNKKWILCLAPLFLIGCSEAYRYPCQDPENWDKKICQKPYCSANGTCPEDLTHYEKNKMENTTQPKTNNKGACL